MIPSQQAVMATILICSLALTGCAAPATPVARPAPTATVQEVALAGPTVIIVERVVTATSAPATPPPTATAPAYAPTAKLMRNSPAGKCKWDVYMSLSGFAPSSRIMVTSDYSEIDCATGKVVTGAHWEEPYGTTTDAKGRLIIAYLHESLGDYLYTFTDEKGNRASLPFSTLAEATPEPTLKVATTAPPVATATPKAAADPIAVVKSATLNLRGGPGQNYPIMGQVSRGDKLYPTCRVGDCAWLLVGVLGRDGLVWAAGGAQYITLNVPCGSIIEFDGPLPTPMPTNTPAPRPATRPPTGELSRSGSFGSAYLEIKNGTDSDGVVILVTLSGAPVQAAYIRAGDSYRMSSIADGTYRLYFTKGSGWDATTKQFTSNVIRQRFEDVLSYGPTTAGYEVTLYGVAGGNAGTENVPAGQFPAVP